MTKRHAALVEAVARIDRVPKSEVRCRVEAWVRETERLQREAAARDRERWGRIGMEPPRDGDRYLTARGPKVDGWPG